MSDERQVVRVAAETAGTLKKFAERKGIGVGEAADSLIATAASRLAALARYQKNTKGEPKPKKAKAEKKPKKRAAAVKKAA